MEVKEATVQPEPAQKPKEDKGATAKALCLFFGIIALCACSYIVYDKFIASRDQQQCVEAIDDGGKKTEEGKSDEGKAETEDETSDNELKYKHEVVFGTFYVAKNGDVYLETKEGEFKVGVGEAIASMVFEKGYEPGIYGEYTIKEANENKSFKGYKLDIKAPNDIMVLNVGNNWLGWNVAFTYPDGHLDWLFIAPYGHTAQNHDGYAKITKNVGGFTDIVSVKNESDDSGWYIIAILKDGKRITINDIVYKLETIAFD